MRRERGRGLLVFLLGVAAAVALTACRTLPPVRQTRHVLERPCGESVRTYEYLLYLPDGYDEPGAEARRWPLLLYLPGMLSSGRGKRDPIRGGPPREVEEGRALPLVMITPFTPTFLERWSPDLVRTFLDHAAETYRIDQDRVYVTGVSIGGAGAWDAAQALPDRIAAIVPVAAWGTPWNIRGMADVPVWAFHGQLDFAVPSPFHLRMVKAHRCAGGRPCCTVIPGGFHWIWDEVYARDDVYAWLLAQRLSAR